MGISIYVDGSGGTKNKAKVTKRGQLVVAPLEFSEPKNVTILLADTAYNVIEPKPKKKFVITSIVISGARSVGINGALVELYEADAIDETTSTKNIYTIDIARSASIPILPLDILINKGKWLNIKAGDVTVYATISGYYIGD